MGTLKAAQSTVILDHKSVILNVQVLEVAPRHSVVETESKMDLSSVMMEILSVGIVVRRPA